MLSLPPPPPLSPSTLPTLTPPPRKQGTPVSLKQLAISKPSIEQQSSAADIENLDIKRPGKPSVLRHPRPRQTNMFIWCCASLCLIFSLVLIFFGIATLIIFLVIRPRYPVFDTPNATLNTIYFDSPEYFNGDFTFLANFSNPNRKIGVRFEFSEIELYFFNRVIATRVVQPFSQQAKEQRSESVHMISSLVFMPQDHAVELRKQVQSNRIKYNIRASFKVKATFGVIHFSYWLHSRCQLEMTGPPTGSLVAHSCQTKR
ncbi:Late embryogenesis abundant protein [Melia azedarach]|uniref:Late embryogenesis abundant protein n=1 Tax=Melia azedarach TaxID=155640 RepID=A0ACC1YPL6_MELAZ|nr:Late embryogenesis abundant protein [Melia azedarach]